MKNLENYTHLNYQKFIMIPFILIENLNYLVQRKNMLIGLKLWMKLKNKKYMVIILKSLQNQVILLKTIIISHVQYKIVEVLFQIINVVFVQLLYAENVKKLIKIQKLIFVIHIF